jgi:hypothetical protein
MVSQFAIPYKLYAQYLCKLIIKKRPFNYTFKTYSNSF